VTSAAVTGLGSFSDVDATHQASALIAALDEQAALPAVQRLRATAARLLRPKFGDRLLDVGCGTGDVVRALAGLVGPGGSVVGVDPSAAMLHEARSRTHDPTLSVDYRPGDIAHLDFDTGTFDGVTCERVFQHLDSPEAALEELVRVTRTGGRIVVVDTDWGMHAIHGADPQLTRRVIECWATHAANGWSGRRLPGLFAQAGLAERTVVADTVTSTTGRLPAPPFSTMAECAARAGRLSDGETQTWLSQLTDADECGQFFWAVTMFAVAGTRP
jgi:SAM-dependent methyltransferase